MTDPLQNQQARLQSISHLRSKSINTIPLSSGYFRSFLSKRYVQISTSGIVILGYEDCVGIVTNDMAQKRKRERMPMPIVDKKAGVPDLLIVDLQS